MSAKEKLLEAVRTVPDTASLRDLFKAIRERFQESKEWTHDDPSPEEWMLFVANGFRDELADPREDIYDLTDGEPIHEAR